MGPLFPNIEYPRQLISSFVEARFELDLFSTSESDSRRVMELGNQKLQTDLNSKNEKLAAIHEEVEELRSSLNAEMNAKILQVGTTDLITTIGCWNQNVSVLKWSTKTQMFTLE